jgi:Capsular polysaccharide synthesis protein
VLPKTIWCLWFQGWDNAPDLVKACCASWRRHNPGWAIRFLSRETLGDYLPPSAERDAIENKNLPLEALSDLARIELLSRFGGVWVDSTVYCLRPLDDWLPQAMPRGFFAFDRPGPDRMVSTWFLAAERRSHVVEAWRRRTLDYWQSRAERHHYFWLHYLFGEAYGEDAEFRDIWDSTVKISADGPHWFTPCDERLSRRVSGLDRSLVETAQVPVLKLTHKVDHAAQRDGTVYRWLCDRMNSAARKVAPVA